MSDDGPHPTILDRYYFAVQMKGLIDNTCGVLRKVIDHATWALVRCNSFAPPVPDEHLATMALYRHVIEMADAVEILIGSCAPHEALPNLRSEFEGWLSLEYILRDPGKYSERSYAWLVTYAAKRLQNLERFVPGGQLHAEFRATVKNDAFASGTFTFPDPTRVEPMVANLRSLLAEPHLAPAKAEYDRIKAGKKGSVCWYELFGGPKKLAQLAHVLGHGASYSQLYGHWSNVTHAADFSDFLTVHRGQGAIKPLRQPQEIPHVASMATSTLLHSTRIMLAHFRGDEDSFMRWYRDEVREQFLAILGYEVVETQSKA